MDCAKQWKKFAALGGNFAGGSSVIAGYAGVADTAAERAAGIALRLRAAGGQLLRPQWREPCQTDQKVEAGRGVHPCARAPRR